MKRAGYDLNRVLIVDDSPEKAQRDYGNAIYVAPYQGEREDCELQLLSRYLQSLATAQSVRRIEKRAWRSRVRQQSALNDGRGDIDAQGKSIRDQEHGRPSALLVLPIAAGHGTCGCWSDSIERSRRSCGGTQYLRTNLRSSVKSESSSIGTMSIVLTKLSTARRRKTYKSRVHQPASSRTSSPGPKGHVDSFARSRR